MRVDFLESGDPHPRLEIPADTTDRRYLYARGTGLEYGDDNPGSGRPSAVDYRYLQVLVD